MQAQQMQAQQMQRANYGQQQNQQRWWLNWLRHLAISLSKLPKHPCNSVELEQYQTEGDLAALWLAQIDAHDGQKARPPLDLAGNGILGHGAQLLGAEVTFVECDLDAAALCQELGPTIIGRVGEVELPCVDIVITNPPWGVQTHGADRASSMKPRCAPVVHMMQRRSNHLPEGEVILEGEFRMPFTYQHHNSRMGATEIKCWRFTRWEVQKQTAPPQPSPSRHP